jgi:hypothetical protein
MEVLQKNHVTHGVPTLAGLASLAYKGVDEHYYSELDMVQVFWRLTARND